MEYYLTIDCEDISQPQSTIFSYNSLNIIEIFPYKEDNRIGTSLPEEEFRRSYDHIFSTTKIIRNNETIFNVEQKETNIKKENTIKAINIKSTAENSLSNKIIKQKRIIKNKANMGRKKRGISIININNKYRKDNVRLRYKRAFINCLIDFINSKIDKCEKLRKKGRLLKLSKNIIEKTKKRDTLIMLNTSAREYLSKEISTKWKTLKPDHNKKLIDYIYEINEISITNILDKSINDLMNIFCNEAIEDNDFKDFKRLQYYIDNELVEVCFDKNNYIELFKEQAKNYKEIIEKLDGRYEK